MLAQKGLECFCPLINVKRQWSDRIKWLTTPLFESYIFVKMSDEQRQTVRMTPGVRNFVYSNGKPAFLKKKEIETLKLVLLGSCSVQLFRLPFSEAIPQMAGQTGEKNSVKLGSRLKKARIYIGETGYEVWAAKAPSN